MQCVHPIQGHDGQELYVVLSAQCTTSVSINRDALRIEDFIASTDLSAFHCDIADDAFLDRFACCILKNHRLSPAIAQRMLDYMTALLPDRIPWAVSSAFVQNPVFKDYVLKEFSLEKPNPIIGIYSVFSQAYFASRAMEILSDIPSLLSTLPAKALGIIFDCVSANPGIPFTPELIEKFENQWSWESLIKNPVVARCFTPDLVDRYSHHYTSHQVSNSGLMSNPELLKHHLRLISNPECQQRCFHQQLVCNNTHSAFTLEILRDFEEIINWVYLSGNYGITFSMEMLVEFENEWQWHDLLFNPAVAKCIAQITEEEIRGRLRLEKSKDCLLSLKRIQKPDNDSKYVITKTKIEKGQCVISLSPDGTDPVASCTIPEMTITGELNVMQIPAIVDCVDEYLQSRLPEDSRCAICLRRAHKTDIVFLMNCVHVFHKECIDKVTNQKCPMCRQQINMKLSWETVHALWKRRHIIESIACK